MVLASSVVIGILVFGSIVVRETVKDSVEVGDSPDRPSSGRPRGDSRLSGEFAQESSSRVIHSEVACCGCVAGDVGRCHLPFHLLRGRP